MRHPALLATVLGAGILAVPGAARSQDYHVGAPSNLSALSPDTTFVNLSWMSPEAWDNSTGASTPAASYDVRMSTIGQISQSNWNEAIPVPDPPFPSAPNTSQSMIVPGLSQGTTYFFAIRAWLGTYASSISSFSPVTTRTDLVIPGTITNLVVVSVTASSVGLAWTATGDDNLTGMAARYDLRYATWPIQTLLEFESAMRVTTVPAPAAPGTSQHAVVEGLVHNTRYWFAIRAEDEVGNTGLLASASPSAQTPNEDGIDHGAGDVPCGGSAPAGLPAARALLAAGFVLGMSAAVRR